MGERLRDVVDRTARHPGAFEHADQCAVPASAEHAFECGFERRLVLVAQAHSSDTRDRRRGRRGRARGELDKEPVIAGGDDDVAVGRGEGLERGDRGVPRPQRPGISPVVV